MKDEKEEENYFNFLGRKYDGDVHTGFSYTGSRIFLGIYCDKSAISCKKK